MKKLTPTYKGLFVGVLMIAVSFVIYLTKGNFENKLQYIVYSLYVGGVVWTIIDFKKNEGVLPSFKDFFAQGFKFFIVVTLLMVLFTIVFILMHPELKDEMITLMQKDLASAKDLVQNDIDNRIASAKKMYLPAHIMGAVFGYLVIGALVSAVTAGFLSQKKNMA